MSKTTYTVEQAMFDTGYDRAAVIAMFKAIASRGLAIFKIGRRGHRTRLES